MRFSSRVAAVQGATVTLERALPLAVQPAFQPCAQGTRGSGPGCGLDGELRRRFDGAAAAVCPAGGGPGASRLRAAPARATLRSLPACRRAAVAPRAALIRQRAVVSDVGLEGFAMHFRHQPYGGHHLEAGFNGIELSRVRARGGGA